MKPLAAALVLVALCGAAAASRQLPSSASSSSSSLRRPRTWVAAPPNDLESIRTPPRGGAAFSDEKEEDYDYDDYDDDAKTERLYPAAAEEATGPVAEAREPAPPVAEEEPAPIAEAPPPPPVAESPVAERAAPSPPPPASAAATTTTKDHTSSGSAALANLKVRAPPAVAMLAAAYALVRAFGENGVIALVLALQAGMYHETCSIVEAFHDRTEGGNGGGRFERAEQLWERWWWFATVATCTSLRNLVERSVHLTHDAMDLVGYGMAVVGILSAVTGMATHVDAGPERFRGYLGKVAASHFALLFLVGQSSFWIKTVHEFGLTWVLFPALLVVVNDTMAYAFGILMGKHKLLPRLSPKKTVEGFAGAALSTMLVAAPLLNYMLNRSSDAAREMLCGDAATSHALAIAAFVSLVSPFGGFLASAVKRAHGAKDFGTLIPGHGGVVDRFDCQVVTAPFVYLYLKYKGGK